MDQRRPNRELGWFIQNRDFIIGQLPDPVTTVSQVSPDRSHVVVHHSSTCIKEEQVVGTETVANLVEVFS